MKHRFIFLNSHPIQYFAPMYAYMARENAFDITVWYCSQQSVEKQLDRQFNVEMTWDIPLLEGYPYTFLKNYARHPSIYNFWGLQNWGIIRRLRKAPKSIVVINGWQFFLYLAAIVAGKFFGHTICLRGESTLGQELKKSRLKRLLRKVLLGKMLFQLVDYFCYIGVQNKAFYRHYGVPESKLIFTPYSVDNRRFQGFLPKNDAEKAALRRTLRLPENEVIILYSGKYIDKKRPQDLLQAFLALPQKNCSLVLLGDGPLRAQLEEIIHLSGSKKVVLTGFVNQAEIPNYYAAADIFVMCSEAGETWGLAVNEAMNLALPLVISDEVGCVADLVELGVNGFVYPVGDIAALSNYLTTLINDGTLRRKFGAASLKKVNQYSYQEITDHLSTLPFG